MQENPTVVFTRPSEVVLEDRPMPKPEAGQVLIQTLRTMISTGTELTALSRRSEASWEAMKLPFLPGYNHIGRVVDVGEGVEREWIGRKVGTYGNHARFVVQDVGGCRSILHEQIPDDHAVFFTTAEIVMNGVRRSGLKWGESVVVFGLGLLGQLATRICRIAGALPVFAVDVSDERIARLTDDKSIVRANSKRDDILKLVQEHTRGRLADVVIELTGVAELIPSEFAPLRKAGRFVVLSSPRGKTTFEFHPFMQRSQTIIGAHNMSHPRHAELDNPWTFHRDAELFFDWLASGAIDVSPLISHRSSYQEAPKLYKMLLEDRSKAMGVVMEW